MAPFGSKISAKDPNHFPNKHSSNIVNPSKISDEQKTSLKSDFISKSCVFIDTDLLDRRNTLRKPSSRGEVPRTDLVSQLSTVLKRNGSFSHRFPLGQSRSASSTAPIRVSEAIDYAAAFEYVLPTDPA